ncbi:hypothetical protein IQ267_26850 [filamentous cyanobacterium LEGE 07170]|nr:hypothetical protein [filamentous cyanobacterium LEGE 07170]
MNSLLPWIFGSTLGGGTAAIGTVVLYWLLSLTFPEVSVRPDESSTIVEVTSAISALLVGVLIGCLHGGLIGSCQGL